VIDLPARNVEACCLAVTASLDAAPQR